METTSNEIIIPLQYKIIELLEWVQALKEENQMLIDLIKENELLKTK